MSNVQREISADQCINGINQSEDVTTMIGGIGESAESITVVKAPVRIERRTNFLQLDIMCNEKTDMQQIYDRLENYGKNTHKSETAGLMNENEIGIMIKEKTSPYSVMGTAPCMWAPITANLETPPTGIRIVFLLGDVNMYLAESTAS